jgi:Tfp pilus assembly protein PilF
MNKKQLIVILTLVMFLAIPICQAQDSDKQVDLDKLERYLYQDLRTEHPDKNEAEIEEAIGYAFLHSENQRERATVHFKKAVELDPKLHFSWYNLGLIYVDTEEGYNYFQKATEAKPDFPPPYYWMAHYRCRNREDKEAIPLFQKYLEVAKDDEQETGRVEIVQEVLQDLLTGKEGPNLRMMR